MLTEKRYEVILDLLEENEVIKSSTIAGATNSSESTIRRDLINLENRGLLKRIHGGAKSLSSKLNKKLDKPNYNLKEKRVIGEFCANIIEENDYIFLDGSDVSKFIIKNIHNKKILLVTNDVCLAVEATKLNIEVYLIGGKMLNDKLISYGSNTLNEINKINFDKVFLSPDGIDRNKGYTVNNLEVGKINEALCDNAKEIYIVADNNKINNNSKVQFLDLKLGIIITTLNTRLNNIDAKKIIRIEL